MTVVVKIPDKGCGPAPVIEAAPDMRYGGGGLGRVDGDPHQLRTRRDQFGALPCRSFRIGGVGVGHRLHRHRSAAADGDVADIDRRRHVPRFHSPLRRAEIQCRSYRPAEVAVESSQVWVEDPEHGQRIGAWVTAVGEDLVIAVGGGQRPHVGCVVLAQPQPAKTQSGEWSTSCSVLTRNRQPARRNIRAGHRRHRRRPR